MAVLLAGAVVSTSRAQSNAEALEYRIKAAFVCKFASYVEWPAQAFARSDSPVVIGVIASDAVAEEVGRTAANLSVEGRPLVVRRLLRGDPMVGVHLVYITRSEDSRLTETLAATKGQPVLVVTESRRAAVLGSMINFIVVDDKVRFDVALPAAESSRLKISARLLGVARNVEKAP